MKTTNTKVKRKQTNMEKKKHRRSQRQKEREKHKLLVQDIGTLVSHIRYWYVLSKICTFLFWLAVLRWPRVLLALSAAGQASHTWVHHGARGGVLSIQRR